MRNNADGLVYSTEKLLTDQAESFQGSEREDVETALASLKEALNGTDLEAIYRLDREGPAAAGTGHDLEEILGKLTHVAIVAGTRKAASCWLTARGSSRLLRWPESRATHRAPGILSAMA